MTVKTKPTTATQTQQLSAEQLLAQLLEPKPLKVKAWEKFGDGATVLGFIVDFITIVSILWASNNNATIIFTNIQLNPFHALMVWTIGAYACLCFVKASWLKRNEDKDMLSILSEVLFKFNYPLQSIILVTFIVAFVVINISVAIFAPAYTVVIFVLIFGFIFMIISVAYNNSSKVFRSNILNHWDKWDLLITARLSESHSYISTLDFLDIKTVWNIENADIDYLLSEYASRNSSKVEFGFTRLSDGNISSFYVLRVRPSVTIKKPRTRKPKV